MTTFHFPARIPTTSPSFDCEEVAKGIFLPYAQPLDLITRARIAHLQFPSYIVGGNAALGYAGVDFESRDAPITMYGASFQKRRKGLHFRLASPEPAFQFLDPAFPNLRVADLHDATVDVLKLIESGHMAWRVPDIPGLSGREIRQVQLLDVLRNAKLIDGTRLQQAAVNRFNARRLGKLGKLSDPGAQSPQETLMRLIVRDVADWESQVELFSPAGKRMTSTDLALRDLLVALFYDGSHHLQRGQRDYDSQVLALLQQMGWRVFRVTSGMLDDPIWLRAHAQQLVSEARAEQASRVSTVIHRARRF